MIGACWLWHGTIWAGGYGQYWDGKRRVLAHKSVYEGIIGPVPTGKVLDHLCRVRRCVNPYHLEPVTNRENILRGVGTAAVNARKTHCPHGHPYDAVNTHRRPSGGRVCRQCAREKAMLKRNKERI